MNIAKRKEKLISKLKNKEYRDAFLAELITTGIPFQIKALREQRNLTQKELGDRVDMAQESISRLEDPNYGSLNLNTLKRLAFAFDVGLIVRFVPFSELVEWDVDLSTESLKVLSFDQESYFQDVVADQTSSTLTVHDIIRPENPITCLADAVTPHVVPKILSTTGRLSIYVGRGILSDATSRAQAISP